MKRMFFRKSDREKLIRFIGVVVIALLCLGGTAIAATVVVTPGSMDGWTFYKTDGDPTYTYGAGDAVTGMVNGPGTPPLGTGSAHFNTGSDGSQSAQLRNDSWAGTSLSSLTSLGYSTYATSWNGQQVPYLTIWLSNGDRIWFEPDYSSIDFGHSQPAPALNTWQTWDALGGMWYSDLYGGPGSGAITFAALMVDEGAVTIVNNGAKGGIRIASGFASLGDVFDANVDAFTIGTDAGTTTYNFEQDSATVPEPATVLLLGLGLVGLAGLRRKFSK